MVNVMPGDAFLMQTPTGYAFGAVVTNDDDREVAFVVFQNGGQGTAAPSLVRHGMQLLARMAIEVTA